MASLHQPSRASGPQSAAWVIASLFNRSRGASRDSRASILLQGHSPPLLWPAPRLWGHGPCFGAWPHSSGQPHRGTLGRGGSSPTLCPSSSGARRSLSAARSPHLHRRPALRPSWHRHGGVGQRGGAGWRLGVSGRWPRARAVGQAECGRSRARGQETRVSAGVPALAPPPHAVRHKGVWARPWACVCSHSLLPVRVRALWAQVLWHDSHVPARCWVFVQPPRLPLRPRKPTHRQSPSRPVATRAHKHPSSGTALSRPAAAVRVWSCVAGAVRGPLLPSAARSQSRRAGGSCAGSGAAASQAGQLLPGKKLSPSRQPLPPTTAPHGGEATTTSHDSIPRSSPAASAPSTPWLHSPPQKKLHSRELIPGHPGLSPLVPSPRQSGLDGAERGWLGNEGLQGQGGQMRWADSEGRAEGEGDVGWEKEVGREGGSVCTSVGARWGICPMALLATGV